ncbi:MAG: hypothetical protein IPH85_05955 [Ignavibacteria bacterium]|nr:hypothetical protein [Ignavibacteria bacterium]MBP6509855.1 hypothetical protein [Candidatus Kapabacteria bacterium]MBK6417897.1 hypothetical protein [Ignavibacteria bacterium]MBK7031937.1 hypothetical protein [Ignavibacteria bacterium]MBK7185465.1 hypothetical protein [Ignavibacteria bacterium]
MLKKLIIISAVLGIPLAVWIASTYGDLKEVTFEGAQHTETTSESDQAPKVIIVSTIVDATGAPSSIICKDESGAEFRAQFTGAQPEGPFLSGQVVRFVGHVHGGGDAYFHATQVYAK